MPYKMKWLTRICSWTTAREEAIRSMIHATEKRWRHTHTARVLTLRPVLRAILRLAIAPATSSTTAANAHLPGHCSAHAAASTDVVARSVRPPPERGPSPASAHAAARERHGGAFRAQLREQPPEQRPDVCVEHEHSNTERHAGQHAGARVARSEQHELKRRPGRPPAAACTAAVGPEAEIKARKPVVENAVHQRDAVHERGLTQFTPNT